MKNWLHSLFGTRNRRSTRRGGRRSPGQGKALPLTLETLETRLTPALALTPAGTALGLTLTTFASGFPVAHTAVAFKTGVTGDGVAVALDGQTVYVARASNAIVGFDTTTGNQVFSTSINLVDGSAIGTGTLAGNIFGNTNDGNVWMVNL